MTNVTTLTLYIHCITQHSNHEITFLRFRNNVKGPLPSSPKLIGAYILVLRNYYSKVTIYTTKGAYNYLYIKNTKMKLYVPSLVRNADDHGFLNVSNKLAYDTKTAFR